MFETDVSCENVACNAVVDLTMSQSANELFASPNSSVRRVTIASALAIVCDVGSTKKCVTSPPRSMGSRLTSIEEFRRTGFSIFRHRNGGVTLILPKFNHKFVVGNTLSYGRIMS